MCHSPDTEALGRPWPVSSFQAKVGFCLNSRIFTCLQDYPGTKIVVTVLNAVDRQAGISYTNRAETAS